MVSDAAKAGTADNIPRKIPRDRPILTNAERQEGVYMPPSSTVNGAFPFFSEQRPQRYATKVSIHETGGTVRMPAQDKERPPPFRARAFRETSAGSSPRCQNNRFSGK